MTIAGLGLITYFLAAYAEESNISKLMDEPNSTLTCTDCWRNERLNITNTTGLSSFKALRDKGIKIKNYREDIPK